MVFFLWIRYSPKIFSLIIFVLAASSFYAGSLRYICLVFLSSTYYSRSHSSALNSKLTFYQTIYLIHWQFRRQPILYRANRSIPWQAWTPAPLNTTEAHCSMRDWILPIEGSALQHARLNTTELALQHARLHTVIPQQRSRRYDDIISPWYDSSESASSGVHSSADVRATTWPSLSYKLKRNTTYIDIAKFSLIHDPKHKYLSWRSNFASEYSSCFVLCSFTLRT